MGGKENPAFTHVEAPARDEAAHRQDQGTPPEREVYFRLALENTSDIITVFDEKGRITYQSPAIGRILGIKPQTRVGANIFDSALVHPDDRGSKRRFIQRLLEAKPGQQLKGDFRLRHTDGTYRNIEAIGVNKLHDPDLRAVVLSSRDVTRRKVALAALAESEARYALTFNNAPIGIAHTDPADGHFLLANQYLCYILGYSQKELRRKRLKDITGAEDLAENSRAVQDMKSGRIDGYHREQHFFRKDGSMVWVNVRMAPQRGISGRVDYFLITVEDISERKLTDVVIRRQHELEAKAAVLAEQREQLLAINKAKDEFVSLASHQLRTPATSVKQYVGLLMQGYIGDVTPEQQDFLAKAYESNERQLKIINQLLYVARIDAGKVRLEPDMCNLSKLLTDIVEEQRLTFKEQGHEIGLVMPTMSVTVPADERLLRMAIENLIDNASKYSPAGKPIMVSLRKDKHRVEIAVRDRGVGIPKELQASLFQKFSRVENPLSIAAGGSGLGLYWAKKVIDLHRGQLGLASKPRQGSTFTITLPSTEFLQRSP